MSDYLDRQVARSVAPAMAVSPRLLSAYEVPRTLSEASVEADLDPAVPEDNAVPSGPVGLERLAQLESLWGRLLESRASSAGAERNVEPRKSGTDAAVRPQVPERGSPARAAGGDAFPIPHDGKTGTSPDEPAIELQPERGSANPPPNVAVSENRRPFPSSSPFPGNTKTGTPDTVSPLAADASDRQTGARRQAESAPSPMPRDEAKRAPKPAPVVPASIAAVRQAMTPRREPAAEKPSIHVTIGRVEVRATPAPTTKSRQPRAETSVLSLGEYLRQRASGGGER